MSRISRSPNSSPSFRAERPFRSASTPSNEPSTSTSNQTRKNLLLSKNQLSNISKKLANIRHGSTPELFEPEPLETSTGNPTLRRRSQTHTIGDFSPQIQEYAIIEELLYVLTGIDGVYIKFIYPKSFLQDESMDEHTSEFTPDADAWNAIKYDIDPTLDPSLKHLVEKLLPLATYYTSVDAFVNLCSRYEYGTINHALCSGIRVFIKEYLTFMAQLEHQFQTSTRFTLQRLWFYAQSTIQNMKVLHDLAMTIRAIQIPPKNDEEEDFDAVIEGLQKEEASDEIHIPEERKGGAILNILSERLIGLSGDPNSKKMYTYLLSETAVPYFEILNAWIYHGEIRDPYNEFMVLEKRNVKKENLKEDFNDTYWEMRYTIREGGVPIFLETMKNQILLAGKYLNVVRECGVSIANPEEMQNEMSGLAQELSINSDRGNGPSMSTRSEVWAAVDGSRFVKNLQVAYKYANQTLLNLLMEDQQLIGRLRSIKHYFFLDQSDFLTSFLDLAKDELKQPASKIPQNRLQSLMDLVLRNPSSVAAYDPFKEDVKVGMSHFRLIDQLLCIINPSGIEGRIKDPRVDTFERSQSLSSSTLTSFTPTSTVDLSGFEALILDYTVTFPLSLIISRKALTKYQLLFRHILNMKHVEDLLCNAWMEQKNAIWKTRSRNPEIERWKFKIFSLRNRMLTFVQQFAYYVTNEVLEPNYRKLETNLTSISTVDQVLQLHSDFLDTCLTECMLTNSKLLRIFNKLIGSCLQFAAQAENYTELLTHLEQEQRIGRFGLPNAGITETSSSVFESSMRMLQKMEDAFLYHMSLLIEALNYYSAAETVQFLCLVVRLDYNQFYNNNVTRPSRQR
ncbi:hypothetical protein HPULCUR_009142 [Helicostylum pulchrum]|uniref:Spindle pole body component n=1 Tax=Helicostylum pulchrum TaxID=562976 RepID=A0ABP9Y9L8_9FUNG